MKVAATLAVVSALALPSAAAAAATPDKTADFVAYCADAAHFKSCKLRVVQVDISLLAEESCAEYGLKGVSNEDATRALLAWLAAHKETHALPTDEALTKAINTLWPCA